MATRAPSELTNLKLVELSFFGQSSDMLMCMYLFLFYQFAIFWMILQIFYVPSVRDREREREHDLLIATLDPDKMSNILHQANTQTNCFVLNF